jgi:hypothetical protein
VDGTCKVYSVRYSGRGDPALTGRIDKVVLIMKVMADAMGGSITKVVYWLLKVIFVASLVATTLSARRVHSQYGHERGT